MACNFEATYNPGAIRSLNVACRLDVPYSSDVPYSLDVPYSSDATYLYKILNTFLGCDMADFFVL